MSFERRISSFPLYTRNLHIAPSSVYISFCVRRNESKLKQAMTGEGKLRKGESAAALTRSLG